MIKITWINNNNFIKYIAENGKSVCTVNDKIVSKEEGNKIFSRIKKAARARAVQVRNRLQQARKVRQGAHRVQQAVTHDLQIVKRL